MADIVRSGVPRWFTLWQRGLFLTACLLIISLIISIIVALALRPLTPDTQLPDRIETLARWGLYAWIGGLALGLLIILVGIAFMMRRGRKQGLVWRRFGLPVAALVGLGVASFVGVVVETNAVIPFIFSSFMTTECSYRIKVIAFEDRNANGVQDAGEPGITGVKLTAQHTRPPVTGAAQAHADTDDSGSASFALFGYSCFMNDTVSVSAVPPAGYAATTPLSAVAIPVNPYPKQPPEQVFYVGFRKN